MNLKKVAKHLREYQHVLVLMRHAKAQAQAASDMERQLTDKGVKQASLVANGLAELGFTPQRIICSSATRASQTLDRVLKVYGDEPQVAMRQSIYEGGVSAIFSELGMLPDATRTAMLIGHEPALSIAAQSLSSPASKASVLNLINLGMPPAAVVVLASDKPFTTWQQSPAQALAIITAKDFT